MQRALYDPVDPRLLGSLTPDLQYRVNGEVYRFGAEKTLKRFVGEPEPRDVKRCHKLRDMSYLPALFVQTIHAGAAFLDTPRRAFTG